MIGSYLAEVTAIRVMLLTYQQVYIKNDLGPEFLSRVCNENPRQASLW